MTSHSCNTRNKSLESRTDNRPAKLDNCELIINLEKKILMHYRLDKAEYKKCHNKRLTN